MNPHLVSVQMIAATRHEGIGTEADPLRTVYQWFDAAGTLLIEHSDYQDKSVMTPAFWNLLDSASNRVVGR